MLPAWSKSGGQIAYTSYMRNNPDLYVVGAGGGRPKKLSTYKGMNTGASWSPDGSKLAVTLSKDGNPEIYIISAKDGSVIDRITNDKAIDTSPAWSPDGSQLAYSSDKDSEHLQLWVRDMKSGHSRRLTDLTTQPQGAAPFVLEHPPGMLEDENVAASGPLEQAEIALLIEHDQHR